MKIVSRSVSIILVICLITLISACDSSGTTKTPAGTKDAYVATALHEGEGGTKYGDTVVGKVIKDKFNFDLEYISFTGSMDAKESLMLASGDYPEMMWIQGDTMVKKYINAGALVCLDDYLADMPNFKKTYAEQLPYWRLVSEDGKLYKWEANVPQSYEAAIDTFALDIAVRTDALEKEGWPDVKTTSEYIEFFKKAMQDIPESNGKPTIGIVCPFGEGWNLEADIFCNGPRYPGAIGGSVAWDQIDQKFVDFLKLDYVKQSYAFFNEAYREGVLDPESFTDKYAETQTKLDSGQALAVFYLTGMGTSEANPKLIEAGHPEMQYIRLTILTDGQAADGGKRQMPVMTSYNWASMVITKNAKDPARILEVLEYFSSEEGQILNQSGVKDIHYTIVDGKRVPNEEYLTKAQTDPEYAKQQGIDSDIFGRVLTLASDGQPFNLKKDPAIFDKYYATDRVKEAFSKLGWANSQQYWLENCESAPTGFSNVITLDPSTEFGKLEVKMVELKNKYGLQTILAESEAAFEAAWAEMLVEYEKLNPQQVVDQYNALLETEKERLNQIKEQYKAIDGN